MQPYDYDPEDEGRAHYARNGYEHEAGTIMLAKSCLICGRPLRDPASIERGVGPYCAEKHKMFAETAGPDRAAYEAAIETAPPPMRESIEAKGGMMDPRAAVSAAIHAAGSAWERQQSDASHYIGSAMEIATALGYSGTAHALQRVFIEGWKYDEEGNAIEHGKPKGIVVREGEPSRTGQAGWEIMLPFIQGDTWRQTKNAMKAAGVITYKDDRGKWHDVFPATERQWLLVLNSLVDTLAGTLGVIPSGETFMVPHTALPVPAPEGQAAGAPTTVDEPAPAAAIQVKEGDRIELHDGRRMVVARTGTNAKGQWIGLMTLQDAELSMERFGYLFFKKYNAGFCGLKEVKLKLPTEAEKEAIEEATGERVAPAAAKRDIPEGLQPWQREGVLWLNDKGSGVLAMEQGTGKCQLPGALVYAVAGAMRIEDAWELPSERTLGDGSGGEWRLLCDPLAVNSHDNGMIRPAPVTQVYREHVTTTIKVVTLDDGAILRTTHAHRFLTPSGWRKAHELVVGDRVAVAASVTYDGNTGVNAALAELCAWQLAEGHEEGRGAVITNADSDMLARIARLAQECGVTLPATRPDRRHPHVHRVSTGSLLGLLRQIGFPVGTRSAERRIPSAILGSSETARRAFVRAFFEAEGSIDKRDLAVEVSSASEAVIRALGAMLRGWGIWLRITSKRARATNGLKIYRTYWRGSITGNSAARFAEHVGFLSERKNMLLSQLALKRRNTNVEGVPSVQVLQAASARGISLRQMGIPRRPEYAKSSGMNKELARAVAGNLTSLGHADLGDALRAMSTDALHWAKVKGTADEQYQGYVYDLCVPVLRNYVTDGAITHNTPTALAAMDAPVLVVVPASLRENWRREAMKWRPDLVVAKIEKAAELTDEALKASCVIIGYEAASDAEVLDKLKRRRFATLIVDEAQAVKELRVYENEKGGHYPGKDPKRAAALYRLSQVIPRRFFLTGTPMINGRPYELFPLLNMVAPKDWANQEEYWWRYCDPQEVHIPGGKTMLNVHGHANLGELRERTSGHYLFRRTKEVLNLPEKVREYRSIGLSEEAATEYRQAAAEFLAWVRRRGGPAAAMRAARAEVIARLTALRRITGIGKVDTVLAESAAFLRDTGRPLIIMGHHDEALSAIEAGLEHLGFRIGMITGKVTGRAREKAIDEFQSGLPVNRPPEKRKYLDALVCSITAAGVGLTLTRAQDMFIFERVWRPFDLVQAEDRIHRYGQKNQCVITYYDGANTIDDKLAALLAEKTATAAEVIDGTDLDEDEAQDVVVRDMFAQLTESMQANPEAELDPSLFDWATPDVG